MKNIIFTMFAMSCFLISCHQNKNVTGEWVENIPGMEYMKQGFRLEKDGTASSINMETLKYESWKTEENKLILSGKSIGNGTIIPFSDTLSICKLTDDSLIVKRFAMTRRFVRWHISGNDKKENQYTNNQKEQTMTVIGTLVMGHEVRSFTAKGDTTEYWITDKTGRLTELYNKAVPDGMQNYTPVYTELKVIDRGKSDEGFAAEYAGVYEIEDIISICPMDTNHNNTKKD